MATTYDWPAALALQSLDLTPVSITRSGGRSISGLEQVSTTVTPYWTMRAKVTLSTAAHVRAYRYLRSQVKGRANRVKFALNGLAPLHLAAGFDPTDQLAITASGAIGDTTVEIDDSAITIDDLRGSWISINDYLYEVAGSSAGADTLTINPPLREAITTSDTVDLAPVFVGRLTNDEGLPLPLVLEETATIDLSFVEALERT